MKIGILFSGGKDSMFALHWAKAQGWDISCLISLQSKNTHSYMFHTPNILLTKDQAKCLDIPILFSQTEGIKEEELQDLKAALQEAKDKYQIDAVATGAVASVYQESRVSKLCEELGLQIFSPLWQKKQEDVLKEMLDLNCDIRIVAIAAYGLDESYLGKQITKELIEDFKEKQKKYGFHPAGEGGEFESFVVNAPLFKKKIVIEEANPVMENEETGYLNITKISFE